MTEPRAVVGFVERPLDRRILCVWNKRYGGWGMPGGKVEDDETVVQALARELGEETGTSIYGQPEKIWEAPHETKPIEGVTGRGSFVLVFRIRISGEPREMEEGCPVTWLTREEFLAWSPFAEFYRKMFDGVREPPSAAASRDVAMLWLESPDVPLLDKLRYAVDRWHRAEARWREAEAVAACDRGTRGCPILHGSCKVRHFRDPHMLTGGGPGVDEELQRRQCVVEPQSGGTSEPGK